MSIMSRFIARLFKLPPADTPDIEVERDLHVPMPDGVVLLADRYTHRSGKRPLILVRSPYGRAGLFGILFGRLFAERGFDVLIQSCRGTFGSGGEFDAFRNERADGLATVEWMRKQPWYAGQFAMVGPSYLGFVQWAIASEIGPELKAMAALITGSEFRSSFYAGEAFSLDTSLTWIYLLHHQEKSLIPWLLSRMRAAKVQLSAASHLPLETVDEVATGEPLQFLRDWVHHNEPDDDWWQPVDFSSTVASVSAPVYLLGGWYDIFLPQTLADYQRLRDAGHQPYLTIGPWAHTDQPLIAAAINESLAWLRAHLLNDRSLLRKHPVRVYVMGADEWRDYPEFPPAGYQTQRWYLHPEARLSTQPPPKSEPDHYCYDPADPTPAVGGSSLSANAGAKDNRELEARQDVLTYTSAPVALDVEIIGMISAELYVQSSLEHTDFFVRLCDVDPSGKSLNVCDGLARVVPGRPAAGEDGILRVQVELWATAHRFVRGQRIRVQVSSGSHPRFARNTGSGEPLATATTLKTADQTIYHDPAHPSVILLPVLVP